MSVMRIVFWCSLGSVLFVAVTSQVCTKEVTQDKSSRSTYSVLERYPGSRHTRHVTKTIMDMIPFTYKLTECCQGYIKKDPNKDSSVDNCVKPCYPSECQNGVCIENVCECYGSYEKHPAENKCIPACDDGYRRENEKCVPVCSQTCYGGRCSAPNTCSCDKPGWRTDGRDKCVQYDCDPPCANGVCVNGVDCECDDGYVFIKNIKPQCQPSCRNCTGICIAPGHCISQTTSISVNTVPPPTSKIATEIPKIITDYQNDHSINDMEQNDIKTQNESYSRNTELDVGDIFGWKLFVLIIGFIMILVFIVLIIWELCRNRAADDH